MLAVDAEDIGTGLGFSPRGILCLLQLLDDDCLSRSQTSQEKSHNAPNLTSFIKGELFTPPRTLMFMQVPNSMAKLVENDTLFIISDTRGTVDPAQV